MHKCIPYIAAQESTAPGRDPIKAVILSDPSEWKRSVSDEGVRAKENGHRNRKAFTGGSVTLPYKRRFCVGERNAECKIVCHYEPQRGVAISRGRSPTCVWS